MATKTNQDVEVKNETGAAPEDTTGSAKDRQAQLEEYAKRIQADYKDISDKEQECDNTIAELNDRILRQKEAKNIINAQKLQLEQTFRSIQSELQNTQK